MPCSPRQSFVSTQSGQALDVPDDASGISQALSLLSEALPEVQKRCLDAADTFDERLLELPKVGPKTAAKLAEAGLPSPRDLLMVFPRDYDDRRRVTDLCDLDPGSRAVVSGEVVSKREYGRKWRRIAEITIEQGQHRLRARWFGNYRPKLANIANGQNLWLAGAVFASETGLEMSHPVLVLDPKSSDDIGGIVPIYPKIKGIPGRTFSCAVAHAARHAELFVEDPLPDELRKKRSIIGLHEALRAVHLPDEQARMSELRAWARGESPGHRRVLYDDIFFNQLALLLRRDLFRRLPALALKTSKDTAARLEGSVGFLATRAQRRVFEEVQADLSSPAPMLRLVHGDVGSGKTFVAAAAMLEAASSGFQACFMAPTELLARQHMGRIGRWLEPFGIPCRLLVSQMDAAARRETIAALAGGEPGCVVGTHALFQDSVAFGRLALVIVDEQHRFGVEQRQKLVAKAPRGTTPHLLVMTATPIPRTLALTQMGDLDISFIDELPSGRRPVETFLYDESERDRALRAIAEATARGEKAFVIAPTISLSRSSRQRTAQNIAKELSKRFGYEAVCLVHGKLSSESQRDALERFVAGQAQILVSTTVVEVGIDVRDATVMVVEDAHLFGLSQLHQLRGRVGRGTRPSSCHLIVPTAAETERLSVLTSTGDGMRIAEIDLCSRGPGDILGAVQSGHGLWSRSPKEQAALVLSARSDAAALLDLNPKLTRPEQRKPAQELFARLRARKSLIGEEAG